MAATPLSICSTFILLVLVLVHTENTYESERLLRSILNDRARTAAAQRREKGQTAKWFLNAYHCGFFYTCVCFASPVVRHATIRRSITSARILACVCSLRAINANVCWNNRSRGLRDSIAIKAKIAEHRVRPLIYLYSECMAICIMNLW